jgi:hypothetical protein
LIDAEPEAEAISLPQAAASCQTFSLTFHRLGRSVPKPSAVPSNVERVILSPSVEAAMPAATTLTSQATRLPLQILKRATREFLSRVTALIVIPTGATS